MSASWAYVLKFAIESGVEFYITYGRRTKAEQDSLVAQKGVYGPGNLKGAAPYSPTAPHIDLGHEAHALDIGTFDVGATRLAYWLRRHNCPVRFPLPLEPWHLEVYEQDLLDLVKRLRQIQWTRDHPTLRKGNTNRTAIRLLQRYMKAQGLNGFFQNGKFDLATRQAIKRYQRANKLASPKDTTVGEQTWKHLIGDVRD